VCDTSTNACKTTCASDSDCAKAGDHCVMGQCVTASTCDKDGHTTVDPTGARKDCAPYACNAGTCAMACGTVADCAAPNVCDQQAHCVAPPSSDTGSSGGCAVGPRGSPAPVEAGACTILVLTALRAARRKRRRNAA
jgi:hypothetical protein